MGKLERVYWGKLDRESLWGELEIVWGKLVWASWCGQVGESQCGQVRESIGASWRESLGTSWRESQLGQVGLGERFSVGKLMWAS